MTIKHIVLFSFKPSLSKTEIEEIILAIGDLKKKIPQVLSFSWGKNNSPENLHRGYSYGFLMEFKNAIDRKIYLEHPEHIKIVQDFFLPAIVEGGISPLVFDYTAE